MATKLAPRTVVSCESSAILSRFQFSAVLLGYRVENLNEHDLLLDGRPLDVEDIASKTGGLAADLFCADYAPDCPM